MNFTNLVNEVQFIFRIKLNKPSDELPMFCLSVNVISL